MSKLKENKFEEIGFKNLENTVQYWEEFRTKNKEKINKRLSFFYLKNKWIRYSLLGISFIAIILFIWSMLKATNVSLTIAFAIMFVIFFSSSFIIRTIYKNGISKKIAKLDIKIDNIDDVLENAFEYYLRSKNRIFDESKTQEHFNIYSNHFNWANGKRQSIEEFLPLSCATTFGKEVSFSAANIYSETTIVNKDRTETIKYNEGFVVFEWNTNYFLDDYIIVTPEKKFRKDKFILENETFNKKFHLKTNDENKLRMVFTPLAQEEWVKMDLEAFQNYEFIIKNGKIYFIAKLLYQKDLLNVESFLERIVDGDFVKKMINDLTIFNTCMNLTFSLPIFQMEENNEKNNF